MAGPRLAAPSSSRSAERFYTCRFKAASGRPFRLRKQLAGLTGRARQSIGRLFDATDRRRPCHAIAISPTSPAFETTAKRRKGYPSETQVKRGLRYVHGDKELIEKLGRNDPCPCGSGRRFQTVLPVWGPLSMAVSAMTIGVIESNSRKLP
ncbi:MAG: SEC-C domain-containing protein [Rhizobiaceae bacterium]|nr:SEC-C domain-containing protein [Rhizobiaceae bacterium]